MERKLVNTFSKNSSHSAGDEADWSSSARDSANSKSQMFINLNGTKSKSKSKSNATEMKKKKKPLCQAVCYGPTPLGPSYPRGMFGAIEQGQEEAVKFYQAWKAEVILSLDEHLKVSHRW